ncbi:hypothetical protein U1Q18_026830 [Sarracenia purpurea var. burkii]
MKSQTKSTKALVCRCCLWFVGEEQTCNANTGDVDFTGNEDFTGEGGDAVSLGREKERDILLGPAPKEEASPCLIIVMAYEHGVCPCLKALLVFDYFPFFVTVVWSIFVCCCESAVVLSFSLAMSCLLNALAIAPFAPSCRCSSCSAWLSFAVLVAVLSDDNELIKLLFFGCFGAVVAVSAMLSSFF